MGSKEWKNRHLLDRRGEECSPTDETMRRLPGIDTAKDQNLILGPLWQLAAIFFFTMFPSAVFEYILEQVMSKLFCSPDPVHEIMHKFFLACSDSYPSFRL